MGWKFESSEPHQLEAISSVVDVLDGQAQREARFSIVTGTALGIEITDTGVANSELSISDFKLLENIKAVQKKNRLMVTDHLQLGHKRNFTVEMETGTGKTYVYTRTIMELNKKYGFRKFIVVVPSIAIREGVYKSFEITKEHIQSLYPGQTYEFFKYSSKDMAKIRSFATSQSIQVMVINIDAFKKSFDDPEKESKANLIHRASDRGPAPIALIQETRPVVIIDEPQSVDNTPKAKEAIASLNPLFILRYSATHKEKYYPVYKLDPVDAYQQHLVKRIEVKSITSDDDHNLPYIKLIKVEKKEGTFCAKIEIDVKDAHGVKRKAVLAKSTRSNPQPDLFKLSGEREIYEGIKIDKIVADPENKHILFERGEILKEGESTGEGAGLDIKRLQIAATIEQHLDKELTYIPKGIKVLSLFFIDRVANYRVYGEGGYEKGVYAKIFEEEYNRLINQPRYAQLKKNPQIGIASEVHNGYFAQDNKKHWVDTRESGDELRGNADELESTFKLIMQDKEKLVSFTDKLRFIFSHSALKEGWDNPNIFQICTLVETRDPLTKRQKVGRGLRLAVNQDKERVHDTNLNVLTVIANESYKRFADTLQREIESDTGFRFEILEDNSFYEIAPPGVDGVQWSKDLVADLRINGYIDEKGKVTDKLKVDFQTNSLKLDARFQAATDKIRSIIHDHTKKLEVFNADERVPIKYNKRVYGSSEFNDLWNRISSKTVFQVEFRTEDLVNACVAAMKDPNQMPKIIRTATESKAALDIGKCGVTAEQTETDTIRVLSSSSAYSLPDIVTRLQEDTALRRRTIVDILLKCDRLEDFKNNPTEFMDKTTAVINRAKEKLMVSGIKYSKTGEKYAMQEVFSEDIKGYLKRNVIEAKKNVFEHVEYDSEVEKNFAEAMEGDARVQVYMKLPQTFTIDTPRGSHTPDWALLLEEDGQEKLYLVAETKGSADPEQLRPAEDEKVFCAGKHFEAVGNRVQYEGAVASYAQLQKKILET